MTDITRILDELVEGSNRLADALLPAVYDELRKMAAAKLANERIRHSFEAKGLVHKAYHRLVEISLSSRGPSRLSSQESLLSSHCCNWLRDRDEKTRRVEDARLISGC